LTTIFSGCSLTICFRILIEIQPSAAEADDTATVGQSADRIARKQSRIVDKLLTRSLHAADERDVADRSAFGESAFGTDHEREKEPELQQCGFVLHNYFSSNL